MRLFPLWINQIAETNLDQPKINNSNLHEIFILVIKMMIRLIIFSIFTEKMIFSRFLSFEILFSGFCGINILRLARMLLRNGISIN